jgi:hypothetical protein
MLFDGTTFEDTNRAVTLCHSCPCLDACRQWADSQSGLHGVVAGRLHGECRRWRHQLRRCVSA